MIIYDPLYITMNHWAYIFQPESFRKCNLGHFLSSPKKVERKVVTKYRMLLFYLILGFFWDTISNYVYHVANVTS